MFFQSGIRAITMDDIARKNGISKRTLYEMFKDKNELLGQCLDLFEKQKQDAHARGLGAGGDIIDIFFYFLQYAAKLFKVINPLFISDLTKFHFDLLQSYYQRIEKQDEEFHAGLLKRGIEEGIFRDDLNIHIVTKILLVQVRMIGDDSLFPMTDFTRIEVFENMLVCYVRGISTEVGIKMLNDRLQMYRNGLIKFEI
jgi:AcrR family transcriptional regulator